MPRPCGSSDSLGRLLEPPCGAEEAAAAAAGGGSDEGPSKEARLAFRSRAQTRPSADEEETEALRRDAAAVPPPPLPPQAPESKEQLLQMDALCLELDGEMERLEQRRRELSSELDDLGVQLDEVRARRRSRSEGPPTRRLSSSRKITQDALTHCRKGHVLKHRDPLTSWRGRVRTLDEFKALARRTSCAVCERPIPWSQPRHCCTGKNCRGDAAYTVCVDCVVAQNADLDCSCVVHLIRRCLARGSVELRGQPFAEDATVRASALARLSVRLHL
eukprot:TRINITY_DN27018_c0_g1_i1.p1 TRINITY_DN27018_c0_g1~~TRINITY_DN27018_c0_g1_i1.p1  ORF type:complete len:283 (+),score=67.30 TRINITY_DN27018_c0_g1_i1:25-849(+)